MTDKIKVYEDEHAVNSDRLRFGNDAESFKKDTARYEGIPTGIAKAIIEQNGGDEPSGDAAIRKDAGGCTIPATSPTYTREELVEIMRKSITQGERLSVDAKYIVGLLDRIINHASDALIAIGAVRVK